MQKIYICDDNKIQLIKIKNIIQEEILKQEYNMKIEKCYTFLCKVKVVIPGFNHQTKYKSMKEAVGGIL